MAAYVEKRHRLPMYSAILCNDDTSNALMSLMSDGKEMRFRVPPLASDSTAGSRNAQ